MTPQLGAEKRKLEELLARVQANRARLGGTVPRRAGTPEAGASAAAEPGDIDASPTGVLYPPRRPSAPHPAAPAPAVPPKVVAAPAVPPKVVEPPAPPPPLPTVTVTPAARSPAGPAAGRVVRIESAPPVQASVVRVAGAVVPEPRRTIGSLLSAALRVGSGR